MNKYSILVDFFLLLLVFNTSNADDNHVEIHGSVVKDLMIKSSPCFEADFSKMSCSVRAENSHPMYKMSLSGEMKEGVVHAIVDSISVVIATIVGLSRKVGVRIGNNWAQSLQVVEKSLFYHIIPRAKEKIKYEKLETCQKACFVQCLTSHLMKYDYEGMKGNSFKLDVSTLGHESTAVFNIHEGAGICHNFSELASSLDEFLDSNFEISYEYSGHPHAFNSVYDEQNKRTLYFEPQSDPLATNSCQFWTLTE